MKFFGEEVEEVQELRGAVLGFPDDLREGGVRVLMSYGSRFWRRRAVELVGDGVG